MLIYILRSHFGLYVYAVYIPFFGAAVVALGHYCFAGWVICGHSAGIVGNLVLPRLLHGWWLEFISISLQPFFHKVIRSSLWAACMADFSPSYGKVFTELEGLGATWEAAKVLRTRLKNIGVLAVNKPEPNCEEEVPDGSVCRSTDNARYNFEALLPVFTIMKGHTDKVPELPALVLQLREAYKLVGRGNPGQKTLLDQAWSIRYLFGVVKALLYKKTPPRASRLPIAMFFFGWEMFEFLELASWIFK